MTLRVAVVCLLLLIVGCDVPPEEGASGLQPVPVPNLANRDDAVRQQLEDARSELDRHLAEDPAADEALASRFGTMGMIYHVYALADEALACFANARTLDGTDARWSYYAGVLRADRGELKQAADLFEQVLVRVPDDRPSLLRLGDVRFNQGDLDRSLVAYREVESRDPRNAAAQYGLGRVAVARQEPAAAVDYFRKALEVAPDATMIHYPLSQALRKLGSADEADRHLAMRGVGAVGFDDPLLKDLGRFAHNSTGFLRQGSSAFLEGRFEDAERDYRKAVEADPEDPEARKSLASALAKLDRVPEAIGEYHVALGLEPENPMVLYNLGWLETRAGRPQVALGHYEAVVRIDPQFKEAQLNLGLLLESMSRPDEALIAIDTVLRIDPQNTAAVLARPRLLGQLGRDHEAIAELNIAVQSNPDHAASRIALGIALTTVGRPAEAIRVLEQALSVVADDGERAIVEHNLGLAESDRGRDGEAVAHYRRALSLDPSLTDSLFNRANALGRLGRYDEAATDYGSLLERQPLHVAGRLARATALVLAGRCSDAATTLDEGLERIPGEPQWTHTLARLLAACDDPETRDGVRAVELAEVAHRALGTLDTAETIGMALAEAGRYEEAVRWQRRLVEDAERRGDAILVARLQGILRSYEGRQPFRLPSSP
ncbi:MAG: tetratricopeptide repeat protein [Acidobacteriota bacterium]|nr:tetratricopeptide repeat protein [Acidobacteriota bacterium]MDH3784682.1 tetratricopeptide repeat protein [Acidobacteriota bacterium]